MDGQGFYVTLPSNASFDVYPSNKIWNYRTKLAKPIILKEPHEVALIEIQYPRNWHSFTTNDGWISIKNNKMGKMDVPLHLMLAPGIYDSIPRIIKEINILLMEYDITKIGRAHV